MVLNILVKISHLLNDNDPYSNKDIIVYNFVYEFGIFIFLSKFISNKPSSLLCMFKLLTANLYKS